MSVYVVFRQDDREFVAAVKEEWMAKLLCDRINSSLDFESTIRFDYEKVQVL